MKICPVCAREYAGAVTHCHADSVALVQLKTTSNEKASDLLGMVIDGRYRLDRIVGRGGMGTVYAAKHIVVGKEMAVKVLRSDIERSEEILQRFIREAQSANAVRSRHICEMSDFGQLPTGAFYIVMELLDGISLTQALREDRLSRSQICNIFIQICHTLNKAHAAGIVHRDLKPDNVMLIEDEGDPYFVKLVDFGIAKMLETKASDLTETGIILGTPYYMSPEQARGDQVDHRSDIYALGVMMYRAFTGKLPFVADTAMGVLTRHLTQKPELPSHITTSIDPLVEGIILRCLEKKPEDRYQSMEILAHALQQLSDQRQQRAAERTLNERRQTLPLAAVAAADAVPPHAVPPSPDTGSSAAAPPSLDTGSSAAAPSSMPASLTFPPIMPLPMAPASQTGVTQARQNATAPRPRLPSGAVSGIADTLLHQPEAYTNRGVVATRLAEMPPASPTPRTGLWVAVGGGLLLAMLIAGVVAAALAGDDVAPAAPPTATADAPLNDDTLHDDSDDEDSDEEDSDDDEDAASDEEDSDDGEAMKAAADGTSSTPQQPPSATTDVAAAAASAASATSTAATSADTALTRPANVPKAAPRATTTHSPPPFEDIRSPFD